LIWYLGVKILEELLNAHQQQTHTDNTARQYIVVPPEAQHLFQQLSSSVGGEQRLITNSEHLNQLTQALQKAITATTPTNRIAPQQQGQDIITRNRSLSSPMDTTLNGNESSNSTVSSTAPSPMTHIQHNTIMLNKIKDEPQHVPSSRTNNSSNSSIERISLEHNEVLKKEKKRERNRQVRVVCV
jgi:hypothetical protein